jgi:uncharacterized protein YdaU (DUF1376 family)
MPKDGRSPAFLFYPEDFSADGKVEAMTTEQVGAYILLLCKAWHEKPAGSVPDNDAVLARWARLDIEQWKESREVILSPFTPGTDGRLHQGRMVREFRKLQAAQSKRQKSARAAAKARWESNAPSMPDASESHTERNANGMLKDAIPIPIPIPRERETRARADSLDVGLSPIERALCEVCGHEPELLSPMTWQKLKSAANRLEKVETTPELVREFGVEWARQRPGFSAPTLDQVCDQWRRVLPKIEPPTFPSQTVAPEEEGEVMSYAEYERRTKQPTQPPVGAD